MKADTLIKNVLDEKKKGDPCWPGYEMVGMKKKGGRRVPNCVPVDEAVDDMTNAKAILTRYHYVGDPRHKNAQRGKDAWYAHPDGHQVFVAYNPNTGFEWHMYQNNKKTVFDNYSSDVSFYKGDGAYTLANMLSSVHDKPMR